ncbi:PAS domain S-box protein [Fulvivirga sp.]|uniref:PAS domain S-box protein n=1 Tax=Fulvivirga sp. TaxID=1931237 RepID=UPI0032EF6A3C
MNLKKLEPLEKLSKKELIDLINKECSDNQIIEELEKEIAERTNEIKYKSDQLKNSEESYQELLTNLQGLAYQYRPKGRGWETTFISKGAKELTGYSAEEFSTGKIKVDQDLIDPAINKKVWSEIKKALKEKIIFNVKYPIVTKSGAEKWVLDRGKAVYNDKGKLTALEGVMIDITREILQEEKLLLAQQEISSQNKRISEREKAYATLLTNLQGMAYRCLNDKYSTVTFISDGCLQLTGYTSEEIRKSKRFFETKIVRKDYQISNQSVIERALKDQQPYEISFPIICKNGMQKWVSERGIGIYDEYGTLQALEGFIVDITEAKNLEKQLRLAQETIDKAPILIEWIKEDGSFYYVNNETIKVSQFSQEEFDTKKIYEIDPSMNKKQWGKTFKERNEKPLKDVESTYIKKDGSRFPVLINAINIEYDGAVYNCAYINDITNIKLIEEELKLTNYELSASEEELRQQSEELHALNENLEVQKKELENTVYQLKNTRDQLIHTEKMASLGVLVAGIAHELNNPIGYIKTSSEALKMLLNDLNKEIKNLTNQESDVINELTQDLNQMATHINSGAEQAAEIVKGLRTFSRMDKEKIERHNIHDTINNVLLMLHNNYKYKINIIKDFGDIPPIECAPGQINQVLMNLINNAVQAIENEGEILVKTEMIEERVMVTIKDNGPGISEEMQSRIFEPFYTTKEPGEGTGLGLSISLGIIQDHNGSINFTSNNDGTIFTVSLPTKQGAN